MSLACTPLEEVYQEDAYHIEEVPIISDEDGWDIPANDGIRNVLLNAEQLVNIIYTPQWDFNRVNGTIGGGAKVKGMIYSSTRAEDLFVPNNVSLWTFISSLKNPRSYVYTMDVSADPYLLKGLAKPYYGQVCTSFVQYALGIKYNFQIYQMTVWDGFDRVEPQDVDKLRLGDIITTMKGHTRLVTGIRREGEHIVEVAISEGTVPCAKRTVFPVEDIVETLEDGYVFYRYRYIDSTKHTPSPFVTVGDEPPIVGAVLPSNLMVPRRGDRANWRKDERVIIDILSKEDFTTYKLHKNGILIEQNDIPTSGVIDFGIMPYGNYSLNLTNDFSNSQSVDWIVADYSINAECIGHKSVIVSFASKNATPIWVTWRRPAHSDSNNNNMPLWTEIIDDNDRSKGYVVTELPDYTAQKSGLGMWDFKVAFETDYGIISSDSVSVDVQ
jgi:hypothetical protein